MAVHRTRAASDPSVQPAPPIEMAVGPYTRPVDDAEALRVSNAIDEDLKREREVLRKQQPRQVKVMLLGQAESGKSTLQKQFQLYYASQTLDKERPKWRPIVYFNILKAIRIVLNELDSDYFAVQDPTARSDPLSPSPDSTPPDSRAASNDSRAEPGWFPELPQLRSKLLPLVASEDALASDLNGGITVSGGRTGVFVRAGWQAHDTPGRTWPLSDIRNVPARTSVMTDIVAKTLAATQNEIEALWAHPVVKELLAGKLRLDESAAFFLDHIRRIAQPDYMPTTDDILYVRLQTLGVKEHSFEISMAGVQYHWLLYDVGGARGQRQAWMPYFEDATAIIFLAPISAFDQYLEEDPRTNRIDDSLQLFTTICSNKLLQKATLVLMLNKTDLLQKKIQAGVTVRKYISSFGDRPNTYEEVSEYFRAHFIQAHKRKDVSHRQLYLHFTSMINVKTTQNIIVNVNEAILRKHMATIGLA